MKTIHRIALSATLALLAGIAATHAAEELVDVNIPAQSLSDALNAFAAQTGLQLLFQVEKVMPAELSAPAVTGRLTPSEALKRLLVNTGLQYRFVNERTVAIVASAQGDTAGVERTEEVGAVGNLRLAQNDGYENSSVPDESATSSAIAKAEENKTELEEIVVTGTHIRGTENNTAPVTVLDRAYIESTGISTTSRLIESLPQNFALANPSGVLVPGVSFSEFQGSAVNLRAIGEGTTLTLLNGRRMGAGFEGRAADISALPLSAIERVEVLTDGASAIYGSDAVGGVVNFILRRDFKGAETRLRSGWAEGINEYRVSQALGNTWRSGNALVSMEFYKRGLLRANERDFVPDTSLIGSLYPKDENYSVMFTGQQNLTNTLSVFADALFTKRDSYNEGGRIIFNRNNTVKNPQLTATMGLNWQVGRGWQIEGSGSYARNKLDEVAKTSEPGVPSPVLYHSRFASETAQLKADGSVFDLPGGSVRAAVGADWRSESFHFANVAFGLAGDFDQTVRSVFGELYIPIVGTNNAVAGINRLLVSLAGRFDDYSSFGSSFDPRVGVMWEPLDGLRFRATYGTSYVAPSLADYDFGNNAAFAFTDPSLPSDLSSLLILNGNEAGGYSAQQSESSSFGIEFVPGSRPGLQLGLNYYRIDYSDRIAAPPSYSVILANPASFGSLTIPNPTAEQVDEAIASGQVGVGFFAFDPGFNPIPIEEFDSSSVDVIVNTNRQNLSVVRTSGVDLSMQYAFSAAGGDIHLGLTGTYIFELEQQVTSASDPFDTVDTFYNPPDWRVRGSLGWQRQGWAANLFVNHTDSYTDNRASTPVPVSSYTTLDARLAYDFKERLNSGLLSGVTVSANVQNLLDQDPPRAAVILDNSDMGFDPTNANPIGRLIAVELIKAW